MSDDPNTVIFEQYVENLRSADLYVRIEAANALSRLADRRAVAPLIDALDDAEWRGSLAAAQALGALGDDHAVEPIVRALRRTVVDTALFDRSIEFANAAAAALQNLGEVGFQSLMELAKEFSESEFPGVAIVVALGEMHDLRALETLSFALRSSVEEVTYAAAEALSGLGDTAIDPLITAIREVGGGYFSPIRRILVWKFGARAIPALLRALEETADPGVRGDLLDVLGGCDDERVLDPLRQALTDPDESVREVAVFALGEHGDPAAIAQLLVTPRRSGRFNFIAMTLARIGEHAVEPLIAALRDPQQPAYVRVNAATALGLIGDVRALDPILAALIAGDPAVGQAAAHALGDLHDLRAVGPLLAALDHGEDTVRVGIFEALGILADDRAFETTVAAASNPNESPQVRQAAILALGPGYGDRALPMLRDILVGDEGSATHVASMVITRHEANAAPILIELAATAQWERASKALRALRLITYHERDPRIIDFLVTALRHSDWRIRQRAALTLGELGDVRAIDAVIDCLRDQYFPTRFNAAQILGEIGDERAIPALERTLAHAIAPLSEQSGWGREQLRDALQSAILAIRARQDSGEQAPHVT